MQPSCFKSLVTKEVSSSSFGISSYFNIFFFQLENKLPPKCVLLVIVLIIKGEFLVYRVSRYLVVL